MKMQYSVINVEHNYIHHFHDGHDYLPHQWHPQMYGLQWVEQIHKSHYNRI